MIKIIKLISTIVILVLIISNYKVNAENKSEELSNILEQIQKDLKTLEKAVYSNENISLSNNSFDQTPNYGLLLLLLNYLLECLSLHIAFVHIQIKLKLRK